MEDSKRAAKAFVDQYFPVKEPNPKTGDVFGDLFSPSSKKESTNKQGYGGQSYNSHNIAAADGKFHSSPKKSQSIPQKGGNAAEHCEISEPCLMSSSVDYGCRDNYPYDPDNRYPGPSSYLEKKDRKDGSDYANPEIQGSEWWQGTTEAAEDGWLLCSKSTSCGKCGQFLNHQFHASGYHVFF